MMMMTMAQRRENKTEDPILPEQIKIVFALRVRATAGPRDKKMVRYDRTTYNSSCFRVDETQMMFLRAYA
jgi:hypothetical protein